MPRAWLASRGCRRRPSAPRRCAAATRSGPSASTCSTPTLTTHRLRCARPVAAFAHLVDDGAVGLLGVGDQWAWRVEAGSHARSGDRRARLPDTAVPPRSVCGRDSDLSRTPVTESLAADVARRRAQLPARPSRSDACGLLTTAARRLHARCARRSPRGAATPEQPLHLTTLHNISAAHSRAHSLVRSCSSSLSAAASPSFTLLQCLQHRPTEPAARGHQPRAQPPTTTERFDAAR